MSDPVANCTLELACTVGSICNAEDALEDGADVNFGGGAPLFAAIFNRNRDMIAYLLDHGADASFFVAEARLRVLGADRAALIEALMEGAPPDPNAIDPVTMAELHQELRDSGIESPIKNGDWDGLNRFSDKLGRIGAEAARALVEEALDLLRPAKAFGDAALLESVKAEKKKLAAISERYREAAEDIENLATLFLMQSNDPAANAEPAPFEVADPAPEAGGDELPPDTSEAGTADRDESGTEKSSPPPPVAVGIG
ncbi:MAG: hypothetical protein H7A52_15835 [Akkermansiaceae bacterium]|nr:hypothetical protein [Akkermansiaceae bacterium]